MASAFDKEASEKTLSKAEFKGQSDHEDDSDLDLEDLQVLRDLHLAAVDAIRRARRFGTFYVIYENDQIKQIPPDQTGPNEERLLARAARLDQRITELKANEASALNDRPSEKK